MKLILILSMLLSSFVFADDHHLTTLTGTQINLQAYDHAIAGSIKDYLIFGNKDESTGKSELIIKKNGMVTRANFGMNEGQFGGHVLYSKLEQDAEGNTVLLTETFHFYLSEINKNEQTITLNLHKQNGTEKIVVKISADDFRNNHFINPEYSTVINGEEIKFKLNDGQACYNFSTHLITMILASHLHPF
jgi:hypothetical protein